MALYQNGKKIAGYTAGQNSSVIQNVTLPSSEFVLQEDGSYLYTIASSLVQEESIVDVYFSKGTQKVGMKAGIMVTSEAGYIHFHANKLPTEGVVVETLRIINPSQDDSYNEDYDTELADLQNPTFEDYSSTTYSEEFDTSVGKIESKGVFSKILEGIKGSLLNLNTRLTSCNNDLKNYLPLAGGTLSGNLYIDMVQFPYLKMTTEEKGSLTLQNGTNCAILQTNNNDGSNNARQIVMHNEISRENLKEALVFDERIDGTTKGYLLFGEHNKTLIRDYLYPVGSVVCMSSNTNPSTKYDGTWTLIDKEYKTQRVAATVTLSSNVESASVYAYMSGHSIQFYITFKTAVALTDSTIDLFAIDPNSCGSTTFSSQNSGYSTFSDNGQAVISFWLNAAGELKSLDVMVRGSSTASLETGVSISAFKSIIVTQNSISYMLDSFCDRFYFKRTA